MDLQQSHPYLSYIRKLGWKVTEIDNVSIIHRHFFLIGGIAKLQRTEVLPEINHLKDFIKQYKIKLIAIEPAVNISQDYLVSYCTSLRSYVKLNSSPFLPTKTIILDLSKPENEIFKHFSEAKRRAIRKAAKNNVTVIMSDDIDEMIRIKSKSAGFLGILTTYGLSQLWQTFKPKNAIILLAQHNGISRLSPKSINIIGGVFLIIWEKTAYYWIVGATFQGKKLFAPTLLVWEAIKTAKQRGCTSFDFVGVWDERFPKVNKEWLGFTKFKEGFGGRELYYPIAMLRK